MSTLGKGVLAFLSLTILLAILKMGQFGRAGTWGWEIVFMPVWLPLACWGLMSGVLYLYDGQRGRS